MSTKQDEPEPTSSEQIEYQGSWLPLMWLVLPIVALIAYAILS